MNQQPLAEQLRPKTLDEVVGQEHLVGENGVLKKLVASGFLPSIIFWGPPGVGKTTLAHVLADQVHAHFEARSAVTSGLDDIRKVVKAALEREAQRTILFLDEIHRFNKGQQDALLPHVEKGTIILIGATTENPSFEVNNALLSRSRVLVLKELNETQLNTLIDRALSRFKKKISEDGRSLLIELANGDARQLLTILEIALQMFEGENLTKSLTKEITKEIIETAAQKKSLNYDTKGEEHYNTISAFIKSMRASNVDAALYYLARMIEGGEDPLFIARRMVIFASEDIGLAQPTALVVANSVFDGCHKVGYPEAQILLAHGVAYLAQAKKDRSAHDAYFEALEDVKKFGNLPIPLNIRNAPTKLMKGLGYGKGYEMYTTENLLPEKIKGKRYKK